jgi:hypothetical protein
MKKIIIALALCFSSWSLLAMEKDLLCFHDNVCKPAQHYLDIVKKLITNCNNDNLTKATIAFIYKDCYGIPHKKPYNVIEKLLGLGFGFVPDDKIHPEICTVIVKSKLLEKHANYFESHKYKE